MVKNPPAMREIWIQSLGWEDPLEKGMASTHSSILCGELHAQRSLVGWSVGSHRVGHDGATFIFTVHWVYRKIFIFLLTCISMITNDTEHLFVCLINGHLYIFLGEVSFVHFLVWLIVFILSCKSSLYILGMNLNLSLFVSSISLLVFLEEQEFLVLMKSNVSVAVS